eukprot:8978273-Lingulodinium_polyedra.AAC.1
MCGKNDGNGSHLNSSKHLGNLYNARIAIAALQDGRSADLPPPAEELVPFNGRNVPPELLALCEGRHLA